MSDISASRLTPSIMDASVLGGLRNDTQAIANLSEQLATGNVINKPSDNPVGVVQVLSLQASLARSQQYQANAAGGLTQLQTATSTLNTALGQLQSIRTLVLSVGNSVTDAQGLSSVAANVRGLEQSLVSLANTTVAGVPIFGGATGNAAAYSVRAGSSTGGPASVYLGSGPAPTVAVAPGVTVPVGVVAPFGYGTPPAPGAPGSPVPVDVFGVLNQIVADISTGNVTAATGAGLGQLDAAIVQVTNAAGQAGAAYQQLNTLQAQAAATTQQVQVAYSNLQSADIAQVSSELAQQQTTYQSALYAAGKVAQLPSLVSYLA